MYAPNDGTAWNFLARCPVPFTKPDFTQVNGLNNSNGYAGKPVIRLFPNPSEGATFLQTNGFKGALLVTVSDLNGREIWKTNSFSEKIIALPVESLQAGTYLVTVTTANGTRQTRKWIKNR